MTAIIVPKGHPRPLYAPRRARNTLVPDFRTAKEMADAANWVLVHSRKVFHDSAYSPGASAVVSSATHQTIRGLGRTGDASTTGGSLQMAAVATVDPPTKWRLVVDDGASTTQSNWVVIGPSQTLNYGDIGITSVRVDVDPDTEYEWYVEVDGAEYTSSHHPVTFSLHEVHAPSADTADTIATDPRGFYNHAPIYDDPHQSLVQNIHDLWKHNGTQLLSISKLDENSTWGTTSSSYVNMLDTGSSTTVSSSTAGFNLHTEFLNPYHTTDITAVFGVFGEWGGAGTGGAVRLQDASGTLGTLSGFNTSGEWKSTTVTLTGGSDHKVDLQIDSNGSDRIDVHAVSIYVYET